MVRPEHKVSMGPTDQGVKNAVYEPYRKKEMVTTSLLQKGCQIKSGDRGKLRARFKNL